MEAEGVEVDIRVAEEAATRAVVVDTVAVAIAKPMRQNSGC
jgi:hypothetical protein